MRGFVDRYVSADGPVGFGDNLDSKVHGANMGPTWVLSAPDGPKCWPHEPCYQGIQMDTSYLASLQEMSRSECYQV